MFEQAYEAYSDSVFRYCYFRVFQREKALDIMQETYLKTWKYLADGNTIDNIRAFLYKTARNLIIDDSRRKKEESLENLEEQGFEPSISASQTKDTEISEMMDTISKLDQNYREPVMLRHIEGFSVKEIAVMLDTSENTISVRIHRGIKELQKIINHG